MRLPILAGPLRGRWWLAGSRGKILRVVAGSYEPAQTRLFASLVGPGDTVLDVGAHTGYYTLLAAALVGRHGRVWAFEPDPRNARYLRRHIRINGVRTARTEEVAVTDRTGAARFGGGSGSGTGRIQVDGGIEVRTVTLDHVCGRHDIRPTLIKLDVEGAEVEALRGAERTLSRARPLVLLSTHGAAAHHASLALLNQLGYGAEPIRTPAEPGFEELLCRPRTEGDANE